MNEAGNFHPFGALIAHEHLVGEAMPVFVMILGALGALATMAFMMPGLDSFFEW